MLMKKLAGIPRQLFQDESGFILSAELVLVVTVLTLGVIAGLVTVRDAVVTELGDVGLAIKTLDQSYSYGGIRAHSAVTAGTTFNDTADFCTPGYSDDFPPTQLPIIVINPTPGQPGGGEG